MNSFVGVFLSFSDQKPSWHICEFTPKTSWKVLPKFNKMGPKPILKNQLKNTVILISIKCVPNDLKLNRHVPDVSNLILEEC